jgi:hypothetical protein
MSVAKLRESGQASASGAGDTVGEVRVSQHKIAVPPYEMYGYLAAVNEDLLDHAHYRFAQLTHRRMPTTRRDLL